MSCPRWCGIIGLGVLIFCIPTSLIHAGRAISVSASATSIFGDDSIMLTASPSGFTNGESIYIKGAFFQTGSSNYFGYSKKNDGTWIKNGETALSQPMVVIGDWDNQLTVRTDFSDSGYRGEGEYVLKLGYYYTTNGSVLSSVNWSVNTVSVAISDPDPTATPVVPTLTLTPTHTTKPTSLPAPTPTPTLIVPLPTSTRMPTSVARREPTRHDTSDILGVYKDSTGSAQTYEVISADRSKDAPVYQRKPAIIVFALLFVGVGVALLSCGLALEQTYLWNKRYTSKSKQSQTEG